MNIRIKDLKAGDYIKPRDGDDSKVTHRKALSVEEHTNKSLSIRWAFYENDAVLYTRTYTYITELNNIVIKLNTKEFNILDYV